MLLDCAVSELAGLSSISPAAGGDKSPDLIGCSLGLAWGPRTSGVAVYVLGARVWHMVMAVAPVGSWAPVRGQGGRAGSSLGNSWARTPADPIAAQQGWMTWDTSVGVIITAVPKFLGNAGPIDGSPGTRQGAGADVPQVRQEEEEQVRVQC